MSSCGHNYKDNQRLIVDVRKLAAWVREVGLQVSAGILTNTFKSDYLQIIHTWFPMKALSTRETLRMKAALRMRETLGAILRMSVTLRTVALRMRRSL